MEQSSECTTDENQPLGAELIDKEGAGERPNKGTDQLRETKRRRNVASRLFINFVVQVSLNSNSIKVGCRGTLVGTSKEVQHQHRKYVSHLCGVDVPIQQSNEKGI